MIEQYISYIPWIILPAIIHELGHFITAKIFGYTIKFNFELGKIGPIPVPRWTWKVPNFDKRYKEVLVRLAGFGIEITLVPFLPLPYQIVAVAHLITYNFYAGESNDFKGILFK